MEKDLMTADEGFSRAPKSWRESLDRSVAQLAVGKTVDGTEVLRRLDESIARLEEKEAATKAR